MSVRAHHLFAFAAVSALALPARATTFEDQLVQAPTMDLPQRGQIGGSLAHLGIGAADLSRGAFTLPLPIELPDARGKILSSVFPAWSAEHALSEFGMGWQGHPSIRRYRVLGSLAYDDTDDLSSPWGRLAKGDDGNYYPAGLRDSVRVTHNSADNSWTAIAADGKRYTFAAADAVVTSAGTYEWMLSRVDTLLGDSTLLTWIKNASGRAFLDRVTWGGRKDGTQYEASIVYAALPQPFPSYASGQLQLLDRRATTIIVKAKQGGMLQERWRYALDYTPSPIGPAFYLTRLTRTFISGQAEPPVIYDYDMDVEQLASATLAYNPNLDSYLAAAGVDSIQPDHAVQTDMEQNGLTDLEHAFSNTLVRQTASGFVFEPLPAPTGKESPLCRPAPSAYNKPRLLARLRGDGGDPQVVVLKMNGAGASTTMTVCDRTGMTQASFTVSGNWELGPNTRLADTDSDRKPDVVRVYAGGVQVLKNVSGPSDWTFAAMLPQTLTPAVAATSSWILDLNGDGRADLVSRTSSSFVVWYGVGNGLFTPQGVALPFKANGVTLSNLASYQFSFGDFNNDGLEDVILTAGQSVSLYVNQGNEFDQRAVPGLTNVPFTVTYPVVADLSGSGNLEVVFVNGGKAQAIALSTPVTGLLRSADDGKGTVARFGYTRVTPVPGIIQRYSLLASLTLDAAGYGVVTNVYKYAAPVWHSLGRFLVGFGTAEKQSPSLDVKVSFHNDDDVGGVVIGESEHDDRTPGIERYSASPLAAATFHGVPLWHPTSSEHGYRDGSGATISSRTDFTTYTGLCPTTSVATLPAGSLTKVETAANVAALPPELSCLPGTRRLTGTHADPTLDFDYLINITRNAQAQVTAVTQAGPNGVVTLQQNGYDGNGWLAQSGAPGHGTTTIVHDALGRLSQVVAAEGVVSNATRDPLSDALVTLRRDRGGSVSETFGFAYDGQNRLASRWDDVSATSSTAPEQTLSYRFASATQPGAITTSFLVQPGVSRTAIDLTGADGEALASATWAGAWIFGSAKKVDHSLLETTTEWLAPVAGAAMGSLGWSGLYGNAVALAWQRDAGFGHPIATTSLYQSNVSGSTTASWAISGGQLVATSTQNDVYVRVQGRDADGHVLRAVDESGVEWDYTYDALGRLAGVLTPDGGHRLRFDAYGRPSRLDRDGVASVVYSYDAYGRQVGKQVSDGGGALVRKETRDLDSLGRIAHVGHARADGAQIDYYLGYDGGGSVAGQNGQLTHVSGPSYDRSDRFDSDARPIEQHVILGDGWRQVARMTTYRADGAEAGRTITVTDAQADVLLSTTNRLQVDGYGRPYALLVDGKAAYTLGYDGEGRLASIVLADGHTVTPLYDAATHRRRGYSVSGPVQNGTVAWSLDARGLGDSEDTTVGGTTHHAAYTHDARGLLSAVSTDGASSASYAYTASGLPTTTTDALGARNVHHTGAELDVGGVHYKWDASGRVIQRGDATLEYGADGQLAAAHRPGRDIAYRYDQAGARVLELVNGVPTLGWAFGATVSASAYVEPVVVDGITVGMLQNGVFSTLVTDRRGTPIAALDGSAYVSTAYGARVSYASLSTELDFTGLGHDSDLGTVRMGVRDYDPLLGQFWTPDPLYLEKLDKCQQSPIQCGLFGYAGSDPIDGTDPTGMDTDKPDNGYTSLADHAKNRPTNWDEKLGNWLVKKVEGGSVASLTWGIMKDSVESFPKEMAKGAAMLFFAPAVGEFEGTRVRLDEQWKLGLVKGYASFLAGMKYVDAKPAYFRDDWRTNIDDRVYDLAFMEGRHLAYERQQHNPNEYWKERSMIIDYTRDHLSEGCCDSRLPNAKVDPIGWTDDVAGALYRSISDDSK